eukprot:COSAG05_NODE_3528_length_2009_cov_2.081152_1_plen_67_part_00
METHPYLTLGASPAAAADAQVNLMPDNYVECEQLYEFGDFLVITFDYYLAMGPTRMRSLFMDLLLT